jgi:hypothetical protein
VEPGLEINVALMGAGQPPRFPGTHLHDGGGYRVFLGKGVGRVDVAVKPLSGVWNLIKHQESCCLGSTSHLSNRR